MADVSNDEQKYRLRAGSFGQISRLYDEVRPDYPEELINDVISISGIRPHDKILEIGIGTGKATRPFAERGFEITGIDISGEQISIAKRNLSGFSNISYLVSSFESAEIPLSYDLVISAQAFHFIKPGIGYEKVHRCLKDEGYLALFSNFPARDELEQEVRRLFLKYCRGFPGGEYGTLRKLQERFKGSGFFMPVEKRTYSRNIEYSRDNYLGFIESMSWVSTLSQESKSLLFRDLENLLKDAKNLRVPIESILHIAKKKSG